MVKIGKMENKTKLEGILGPLGRKSIAQLVLGVVTWPVLGCLSHGLKSRLEKKFGRDWFDAIAATFYNEMFNIPGYAITGGVCGMIAKSEYAVGLGTIIGFGLGIAESFYRTGLSDDLSGGYDGREQKASFYGKLLSFLPEKYLSWRDKRKKVKLGA